MTKIQKVKNKAGDQVFPITHFRAVKDDNGNTVESAIQQVQTDTQEAIEQAQRDVEDTIDDAVLYTPQTKTDAQKQQARQNLGLGDGTIDNEPTAGSDNLVRSGGVQKELALGAVYDVSAKNPTAGPNNDGKFESLSALLSDANLNTLIPMAVRRGGMRIQFVHSSNNRYVQYRYIGIAVTGTPNPFLDEANWQSIGGTRILERTEVEGSILPNVLNRWGNIAALTISFQGSQGECVNEYMLEFTVSGDDFTLTLPDGIRWVEEPTWEDGYTYQVSITNNLAVYAGWEAQTNE